MLRRHRRARRTGGAERRGSLHRGHLGGRLVRQLRRAQERLERGRGVLGGGGVHRRTERPRRGIPRRGAGESVFDVGQRNPAASDGHVPTAAIESHRNHGGIPIDRGRGRRRGDLGATRRPVHPEHRSHPRAGCGGGRGQGHRRLGRRPAAVRAHTAPDGSRRRRRRKPPSRSPADDARPRGQQDRPQHGHPRAQPEGSVDAAQRDDQGDEQGDRARSGQDREQHEPGRESTQAQQHDGVEDRHPGLPGHLTGFAEDDGETQGGPDVQHRADQRRGEKVRGVHDGRASPSWRRVLLS